MKQEPWQKLLPQPRERCTDEADYRRAHFIGGTLEETLAIRAGYDAYSPERGPVSYCATCGSVEMVPLWSGECRSCRADRGHDWAVQYRRDTIGSTGYHPAGHREL